jgi:hypothetical protein
VLAGEVAEAGFRCWVAGDGDRTVGFAYGFPTPEVPAGGWYGSLRQAVGPNATERAWLATHDLDTPARALYRSLGSGSWAAAPSAGTTPTGWHWAPSYRRAAPARTGPDPPFAP